MSINSQNAFNMALELFSSLYQDAAASDLPAGLSPDNSDCYYLPGSVWTRPAAVKTLLAPPEPNSDTVSLTEYAAPNGDYFTIWLSSLGNLWKQDDQLGTVTELDSVVAKSKFRSVTAFDKQWFAFFNAALSSSFSDSPFVGADVPRYYDGENVWRVTQDAPGANPVFSNIATLAIPLTATGGAGTLTITGAESSGAIVVGGQVVYSTITYTASAPVPATWLGTLAAVTGLTGTNSLYANRTSTVLNVSGDTFVLNAGTGPFVVNLTGESGTATTSNDYFTRVGNIVTAYTGTNAPSAFNITPGLYVSVRNTDNSEIKGPGWTITSISRDETGLVTVTISTQLSNLASGTVLVISTTDTTNFPAGEQTVYDVISSANGTTTFTISNPTWGTGAVATSTGTALQVWNGIFQVLSTGIDAYGNNFFTYFQLGPDTSLAATGGTPVAQIQAQIPPGPRSAVLSFKSINGAITAPSVPVQLAISGGPNLLSAQMIPLGPPGTAQRIISFTPAYGSSFYYVTPSVIPSTAGLSPVLSLGTIIDDNTTTAVILDFSDAQLTAGTQIDIAGNDLFNQVVLAPCLGCIEYEGRMGWWGEINDIKNFVNVGFDGGYFPTSLLLLGPNTATSGVSTGTGTAWTLPADITGTSGFASVAVPLVAGDQSQVLQATIFGITVSPTSNIAGLQFNCTAENNTTTGVQSMIVFLIQGGVIVPGSISKAVLPYSASPIPIVLGGTSDLWGLSAITAAMVNDPTFGIGVQVFSSVTMGGSAPTVRIQNGQISLYGESGILGAQPLGWNNSATQNGITPDKNGSMALSPNDLGFAYQLTSGSSFKNNCMISQGAYQDFYGAPIMEPSQSYYIRFQGEVSGPPSGSLVFALHSASTSFYSSAIIPISAFTNVMAWITQQISQVMPIAIPSDLVMYLTLDGSATTNFTITIDELEWINVAQPVLFQQMRLSYFENEFGYDDISGILSLDSSAKITGAFKQRGYLFALTDGPMYQTQNNGQTEPDGWSFNSFADECDCFGPNAVTTNEDIAWWAGNAGFRVFSGSKPKKISQEIQPSWEAINDDAPTAVWAQNDPEERIVYIGVPSGSATEVSKILTMSYRSVDEAYNVPDPLHTSYSGKMIATDLCRKWTPWQLLMSCGALLTRPGLAKQMFMGGQAHGNFYSFSLAKYTDDDYGQIGSYYTTYFFFNHEVEQSAQNLGLHQKVYTYLAAYITGVGQIQPTALVNNLGNPWGTTATVWDAVNQVWAESGTPENPFPAIPLVNGVLKNDIEWGLNIKGVSRLAIRWVAVPLPGQTDAAFQISHMTVSCREDQSTPVRGANSG